MMPRSILSGLLVGAALVPGASAFADTPRPDVPHAIDLPGDRLHPESVSILPGGTAYVGSMTGGVLRVRLADGHVDHFIAPGQYGSGALFGVLADPRHHLLWTCTNSFPAPATHVEGADPGHWLKAFDLKTGKGRISLALPGEAPVCNDIALGPDGAIYVTDTGQPHVLRWKPGAKALEIWAQDPIFESATPRKGGLDGIAFGSDGALYLTNVRDGSLYRVTRNADGSAGAVVHLAPDRPLKSPDGMRAFHGMTFLLAEGAGRIDRLIVSGTDVHVEPLAEGIKEPTGVDSLGQQGWYVQGQLSGLFSPDKAPPVQLPFRLVPVPR
ncbi:hypothetical protein Y88_1719 [Novosphingobium nitrogenifigens DSM 19370]|uniref:SMP-30/Gluconolactonase/LRE-like region domain-containing protein n=1 Tax=Novosphingobium nitrogenifigens DSM 19370 TaxID=983920 RepID=F1Z3L7_9SPHN|nr:hypothetical protein [Novosphingobium nitrogenifigens]EGD60831.1 hypothetical protein Y88_1719 [Novosphingobium nitrogenifigens DSM 19370]